MLSVDHLEVITDEDVEALRSMENKVPTFPVALRFVLTFWNTFTESRRLVDEGLPLVIATDQPWSNPSGDMLEAVRLGSLKMGLEPLEAIAAELLMVLRQWS